MYNRMPLWHSHDTVFHIALLWLRYYMHYSDVIMSAMMSQITIFRIIYSTIYSGVYKKKSKLRVTGLCEGNSSVTGEFPAQRASNSIRLPFDDNDNDNDNGSMFIVKVAQKSKPSNQQCKYMIHHKKYHQMVKHSRVGHNRDRGGGSDDLCAPSSWAQQVN